MIKVEVNSNEKNGQIKAKITGKKAHAGEALYGMAILYKIIKEHDEANTTDLELIEDMKKIYEGLKKEGN